MNYLELEKKCQEQFTEIFNNVGNKNSKLYFTDSYCQFDGYIVNKENKTIQIIELKSRIPRYESDSCEFKKIFALYKAAYYNDYSLLTATTIKTLDFLKSSGYKISWSFISMWKADRKYRKHNLDIIFNLIDLNNINFNSKLGLYQSLNSAEYIELVNNQYILNKGDNDIVNRFNILMKTNTTLQSY